MGRLAGKRILITGATSGIGFETARQCIAEGARAGITGRTREAVDQAVADLGAEVEGFVADASVAKNQQTLVDLLEQAFQAIDRVFINAGLADLKAMDAFDESSFDRSFNTNVKGPFFLLQALVNLLHAGSVVILNASVNAHIGMPNTSVYGASKAALLSLSRTLSGEWLSRGIRVNAISPGPVATPLYAKLGMSAEAQEAFAKSKVPVARMAQPEEIAKAVVFLASDECTFATGSELIVGGGLATL